MLNGRTSLFVVLLMHNPEPLIPSSGPCSQFILSFFPSSRRTKWQLYFAPRILSAFCRLQTCSPSTEHFFILL